MKSLVVVTFFLIAQSARISSFSIYNQRSLGKAVTTSFIPRTCHEGFESGHPDMQDNGMYWIDPDGHGIGEVPIYVHCEKGNADANGVVHHTTTLLHDKETTFAIPVCNDDATCPGSNDVPFNYTNASERQMWALAELSENCEQSVKITLVRDTLEEKVWWWDRFDNKHVFWYGNKELDNDKEVHKCQCKGTDSCLDPSKACNCDAAVAIPISDEGTITDKDLLPVTKLHFGKIQYEGGELTLGRFHCTGRQGLVGANSQAKQQPESCKDLWMLGYTLNGVYTVKGPENLDCTTAPLLTVYCEFLNPPDGSLVEETQFGSFCPEEIQTP